MATKLKVGDLVWAKMKGFPAWPGKIIEAKADVKRPSNKKLHHFVFFFGSENYAWIPEESILLYPFNRDKFTSSSRIPKGFKEALEAIEDAYKALPASAIPAELPSIEEEIAQIFPQRSDSPKEGKKLKKDRRISQGSDSKSSKKDNDIKRNSRLQKNGTARSRSLGSVTKKDKMKNIKTTSKILKAKDSLKKSAAKVLKNKEPIKKLTPLRKYGTKRSLSTDTEQRPSTSSKPPAKKQRPLPQLNASPVRSPESSRPSQSSIFNLSESGFSHTKIRSSDGYKSPDAEFSAAIGIRPENHISKGEDMHATMLQNVSSSTQIEESMLPRPVPKAIIPTPLRIGFLGLGIMGQGMVMNLLRSGHEVTVWNRTGTKCREFIKAGALRGLAPSDVVHNCDITFTCVADSSAVRDLVFGNSGVLQGISRGKCYVEMSTVDEETMEDVAEAIMARGGVFLEAPVCGSRVPALEGQLIILTSGDRKLYDDCYSCFEAMGKKSFYLGNEVGTATRMKLIHNMILGSVVASLGEGMALAEKVGIDQEDLAEVLSLGSLSCPTINHKSQAIANNKFDPHFPLQHQQKDLRLALTLGDRAEHPLYVAATANEMFKRARRLGYGDSDIAAVVKACSV
ncbi:putative oxidoreductase GLYR1 isoform X2 [Gigantopelta aegis]|uniref:putative oxidoreductase GLYR1 isoform X2 n=1 Tax=Gigantopelta aegis TaxID=1735272 RepID=UPI001B88B06A|nr:putative oxidoreductase GLYR1 isoform X2 [Gigantopelta aegis]